MAAGLEDDPAPGEFPGLPAELRGGLLFGDADAGAAAEEEAAERLPGPLEADDENAAVPKLHVYLNFRVDRLNRAKMMPRIQKRMTTRPSGQPDSSKWW